MIIHHGYFSDFFYWIQYAVKSITTSLQFSCHGN